MPSARSAAKPTAGSSEPLTNPPTTMPFALRPRVCGENSTRPGGFGSEPLSAPSRTPRAVEAAHAARGIDHDDAALLVDARRASGDHVRDPVREIADEAGACDDVRRAWRVEAEAPAHDDPLADGADLLGARLRRGAERAHGPVGLARRAERRDERAVQADQHAVAAQRERAGLAGHVCLAAEAEAGIGRAGRRQASDRHLVGEQDATVGKRQRVGGDRRAVEHGDAGAAEAGHGRAVVGEAHDRHAVVVTRAHRDSDDEAAVRRAGEARRAGDLGRQARDELRRARAGGAVAEAAVDAAVGAPAGDDEPQRAAKGLREGGDRAPAASLPSWSASTARATEPRAPKVARGCRAAAAVAGISAARAAISSASPPA